MPQPLTQADLVILSLLLERPMHGYDVVEEYERQEVKDWASVSKAQVYYALKKLGASGHIAPKAPGAEPDPRGKTVFAVSPLGRAALVEALTDDAWASGRRPQPFATWLGLSIHANPDTRAPMIERRRAFLMAELDRERASHAYVQELDSERARVGVHAIALTIACIEAELAWLDTRLGQPRSNRTCVSHE